MQVVSRVLPRSRCMFGKQSLATHSVRILLSIFLLAGCGNSSPSAGFAPPPAEVATAVVAPKDFPAAFEYVGQTQGSKDVEVRARVTGILEKRLYQEGSPVKAGQPLFTIDPKLYAAQVAAAEADLTRAVAQKAHADRERARLVPLAQRKAIGEKPAND